MIHAKKGIIPKGKYNPKFHVSKLWSILNQYCKVKNVGYDCEIENHFGACFITNEGEKVYITGGFLNLLEKIFELRRSTFDEIIQHLEPNIPATGDTPATEQPTNTKEFDNTTLTQIMNDDMIDLFLKNEKRLRANEFITSENKWINGSGKNQTKTRYDLANLILLLKEKNYLKLKFDRKKLKEGDYRKFFEVRYGCKLEEQFNKTIKVRAKSLETAKTTFFYF